MKKIFIKLLMIILLSIVFTVFRFGNAMTQEGNPIPYIVAITKYEINNSHYEIVLEREDEVIYISGYQSEYPQGITEESMELQGWKFKEQIGSGFVYEKGKEVITIGTRQFTKDYFIWEVPKGIIN